MLSKLRRSGPWIGLWASLLVSPACWAGEGSFGAVTTLDLPPAGELEFEQALSLTHGQAAGKYDFWRSRSSLVYGLTNDLQVGLGVNAFDLRARNNYTNPEACPDGPCTAGFGVPVDTQGAYHRRRLNGGTAEFLWRLSNPVTEPVGVGLGLEYSQGPLADETQYKLVLQSNFLDDSLTLASNLVYATENLKFVDSRGASSGSSKEALVDLLLGASYRFAPRWTAGLEYRYHNDFNGYALRQYTQEAHFFGPSLHYAQKEFFATLAWRRQIGGSCYNSGTAECSGGYVWDSHGRDEIIFKFGIPLN